MTGAETALPERWRDAWPDLLAFIASLAVAWQLQWQTTDLVWSLWLSSFTVGYAMIVWSIFGPGVRIGLQVWRGGGPVDESAKLPLLALGGTAYLVGGLLLLAFFTVHFGMFHLIHSVFLNAFFPVAPARGMLGVHNYLMVAGRYWYYVPLAALAERQAFRLDPAAGPPDTSVKAADIAVRQARLSQGGMMGPYKNVVRMHLLIFFFAFAHFARLDNFGVYAVVYAVYFFPWRLLKRNSPAGAAP